MPYSYKPSYNTSKTNTYKWTSFYSLKNNNFNKPDNENSNNTPITVGNRDSIGGRIVDNIATGLAVGTGSAIAHKIVNSIGNNTQTQTQTQTNVQIESNTNNCEIIKDFYSKFKYKFELDSELNNDFIKLIKLCEKMNSKFN